jgi:hypothetical protein
MDVIGAKRLQPPISSVALAIHIRLLNGTAFLLLSATQDLE